VCHNVTRKRDSGDRDDDEPEKKERVIHTRVPESLEAQLRQRAEDLGISVSNLVRNVLGHAFGLVGGVVADSHAIARAARGEGRGAGAAAGPGAPVGASAPGAAASLEDVLGWQPIVLGKNAVCARCNAILPRGTDAAVGAGTQLVMCVDCLEELRR
jgi:hypothetical protein